MNIQIPHNFTPRDYQVNLFDCLNNGYRRGISVWHRRSGKDKTFINLVAKEMMQHVGTYFYFFPTYAQGRKILWDGMDKGGFKFLDHIPEEIRINTNNTEMKIKLKNGSMFQVVGTDAMDAVVGTNPIGCVFSEYSLQNPDGWELVMPILRENGGWAFFNSCVTGDTLVITEKGMERIGSLPHDSTKKFTDVLLNVYGKGGFHKANSFYNGGKKPLIKITTKRGYTLTGTPWHPVWNGEEWVELSEYRIGHKIVLQRNQQIWGNHTNFNTWKPPKQRKSKAPFDFTLDTDLMYLMGLILAEGCWDKDGKVIVSNQNKEIIDFLRNKYGFKLKDNCHNERCNKHLISFIEWFGIGKGAKNKRIPDKLLKMPKKYISAFLSGYFDGDGSSHKGRGWIHCDSVSESLINDLQILLINYGIISTKTSYTTRPTKKVKVYSHVWRLSFDGYNAHLFYTQIGFRLTRKQANYDKIPNRCRKYWNDVVLLDRKKLNHFIKGLGECDLKRHDKVSYRTLRRLLKRKDCAYIQEIVDDNYYYDVIKHIEFNEGDVYDFVIPETHSFFSNGLISHNTPRGHNHLHAMYNMALNNEKWFAELLTVDDTNVITEAEIQEDRDAGMSEDLIEQEYYCSFSAAQSGQYIQYSIVKTAIDRVYEYQTYQHSPIVISVDVARFGDDSTIILVRQGVKILEIRKFTKLDTAEVTSQVCLAQNDYRRGLQATFVDGVGIGGGVVDQLRNLRRQVWDVQSAQKPTRPGKYLNKRAEMWGEMKDWLVSVGSMPDDKELANDLTNPEFEFTRGGLLKLESKDHMKARGIPSPNKGDSLAYSFYMPVASEVEGGNMNDFDEDERLMAIAGSGKSKWTGY